VKKLGKRENLNFLIECGVIAIIRVSDYEQAVKVGNAIKDGGVRAIEVSVVTPGALDAINTLSKDLGKDVLIGVGTVLDPETCRAAILSGAEFIIGPTFKKELVEVCNRYSKICIPGALTPTEMLTAWEAGADIIKVFPARLGGPRYFRDILAPLPQVRLMPVGGVNLENTEDFIKAGAVAVAVGSAIVDKKAVSEGKFNVITEKAKKFVEVIKKSRK
jgi:2-dehydro-3-deoxyphosphogluconate aldolase/(4S)-4-hydroxy-2-oxoglutarate aldolase